MAQQVTKVDEHSTMSRNPWNITKMLTTSDLVVRGPGVLHEIMVQTNLTDAITISVYDSIASGTGKFLPPNNYLIAGATGFFTLSFGTKGVPFTLGLYISISVAGNGKAKYWVLYDN